MSWLKSAVSKVGEKAEALKSSQAVQRLTEKTTQVVSSAADKVGQAREKVREKVRARPASAIEFEAKLEQRAKSALTAEAIAEMHRSWVQELGATKKDLKVKDGEREMGFKEMLLQSHALEISIEVIASDPALCKIYKELPAADDKTSGVAGLYDLLSKTLSCPVELWSEVFRSALSAEGGMPEGQVAWLVGVLGAIKCDWQEEVLYTERKDLALRAEYLRQEIKQLEAQTKEDRDASDDLHKRRVAASSELLQTYRAVRRNLEEAQAHRRESVELRESELRLIGEQIQAHIVGLQSTVQSSTDRHKHLEGELKQSGDSIQQQLKHMDEVRMGIDKELEELENRKRELRIQLDEVSQELDAARLRQRQHMEKCDKERAEFSAQKAELKAQIESKSEACQAAEQEQAIVERTKQLVQDVSGMVQSSLGKQMEDLQKKQSQFIEHFRALLKDHLAYSEQQLQSLRARAGAAPADSQERRDVAKACEAARQAFQAFQMDHQEILVGTEEEAAVKRLEEEHAKLLQTLGVDESATAEAASAAAAVAPAAATPAQAVEPAPAAAPTPASAPAEAVPASAATSAHTPAPAATSAPAAAPAPAPPAELAEAPAALAEAAPTQVAAAAPAVETTPAVTFEPPPRIEAANTTVAEKTVAEAPAAATESAAVSEPQPQATITPTAEIGSAA